jgi:hypothetical protein
MSRERGQRVYPLQLQTLEPSLYLLQHTLNSCIASRMATQREMFLDACVLLMACA